MSLANSADRPRRRLLWRAVVASGVVALSVLWGTTSAWASPNMQTTGSSFAGEAIQSWVGNAATLYGLNINWQVSSSVVGLNNFAQSQIDFGASDIPYSSGQATYNPSFPYQYMPDVAGGLAFMYNLIGNDGQRITSLRLNAQVVDQIFLGEIAAWNAPAIANLNPGLQGDLPSTKIIPVYRSDASGENYLLSDYMLDEDGANFKSTQSQFNLDDVGQPSASWPIPSGTSINPKTYPGWASDNLVAQSGSDNAANYVSAVSSAGAITYVETAYAKDHNFPVVSLINASGTAVQPTSLNVATALEKAILHADLTQDLTNVYSNPLPNAYPLSAYSYFVTPCSPSLGNAQNPPTACAANEAGTSSFASQKGQALGTFIAYVACAGQQDMADLGYSPLPPNLVQEDFNAIGRLNGGVEPPPVSAATCKNPYVDGQTPLPGEPGVVGQAAGTPGSAGSAAAAIGTTAGGAAGSGGAGSGSSGGAGGSASSGAGGPGGSAGSAGSTGAAGGAEGSAAALAAHDAAPFGSRCPSKFLCADALVAATKGVGGVPVPMLAFWILLALAIMAVPPSLAYWRRRRISPAPDGVEGDGPALGERG